jgi:hypothetical protein
LTSTFTGIPSRLVGTCYKIISVKDVTIPDGTKLSPGTTFTKTHNLANGGTCLPSWFYEGEWPANTKVVFVSGEIMCGVNKTLGAAVPAGA